MQYRGLIIGVVTKGHGFWAAEAKAYRVDNMALPLYKLLVDTRVYPRWPIVPLGGLSLPGKQAPPSLTTTTHDCSSPFTVDEGI